jgi:hypothetical protein
MLECADGKVVLASMEALGAATELRDDEEVR